MLVRVALRQRAVEVAEQLGELLGEVVGAEHARAAAERGGGDRIGAGRPADPEVDAARMQRLEHAELLGHGQRGVVGQHEPARTEADGVGDRREVREQHRRRRAGDPRHVVVLGDPVAPVSEALDPLHEVDRVAQRLGG